MPDLRFIQLKPFAAPAGAEVVVVDAKAVEGIEDVCALCIDLLVQQEKAEVEFGESPAIMVAG